MEEAIVRLVARRALSALDWEEKQHQEKLGLQHGGNEGESNRRNGGEEVEGTDTGAEDGNARSGGGFGVPATLRPLSWRLDFATRLAVSNANLRAVSEPPNRNRPHHHAS